MPRTIVIVILVAIVSACSAQPPDLVRGLPRTFGPTSEFDHRLKERFTVGSDERRLKGELESQRFSPRQLTRDDGAYEHASVYNLQEGICRETWTVLWSARRGAISALEGRYSGDMCF